MKIKLLTIIVLCLNTLISFAQQTDNARSAANAIKKNSDYIYGEAAGDNEEEAYEIAKEKLLVKIQNFIESHPEYSAADAYVIDNIKSKTKRLTYERSIQIKVVCVYVEKKDITPLYESSSPKETVVVVVEEKTVEPPIPEKQPKEAVLEMNPIKQADETIPETISSKTDIKITAPLDGTEREKEILSAVLSLTTYKEIYSYLDNEKNTRYDVRFKLVKNENVEGCYWLIFDNTRKLIAAFNKDKTKNLLHANGERWNQYASYPKVWIQIYE